LKKKKKKKKKKRGKRKETTTSTSRQQVGQRSTTVRTRYILILVFAEVIYSVNGLFLEIRKRPEKLDNIDSS
jgi:hypothetical protein